MAEEKKISLTQYSKEMTVGCQKFTAWKPVYKTFSPLITTQKVSESTAEMETADLIGNLKKIAADNRKIKSKEEGMTQVGDDEFLLNVNSPESLMFAVFSYGNMKKFENVTFTPSNNLGFFIKKVASAQFNQKFSKVKEVSGELGKSIEAYIESHKVEIAAFLQLNVNLITPANLNKLVDGILNDSYSSALEQIKQQKPALPEQKQHQLAKILTTSKSSSIDQAIASFKLNTKELKKKEDKFERFISTKILTNIDEAMRAFYNPSNYSELLIHRVADFQEELDSISSVRKAIEGFFERVFSFFKYKSKHTILTEEISEAERVYAELVQQKQEIDNYLSELNKNLAIIKKEFPGDKSIARISDVSNSQTAEQALQLIKQVQVSAKIAQDFKDKVKDWNKLDAGSQKAVEKCVTDALTKLAAEGVDLSDTPSITNTVATKISEAIYDKSYANARWTRADKGVYLQGYGKVARMTGICSAGETLSVDSLCETIRPESSKEAAPSMLTPSPSTPTPSMMR